MPTKIHTFCLKGLDCQLIEVQADIANGMPHFSIVGLADTSVQESKQRIRSSIRNCGMKFPLNRKTVNLAPAQLKKHGSHFDFPIAISLLIASKQLFLPDTKNTAFLGELSLSGHLMPVQGVLPMVHAAKQCGFKEIFIPAANAAEASFIQGIKIYPIQNLSQFTKSQRLIPLKPQNPPTQKSLSKFSIDNIVGLKKTKRALTIAVAGGHHTLLYGSPGCGKTVIARSFSELLPTMTHQEILQTSKIYSIAGLTKNNQPLTTTRPFREVHAAASKTAILGGGAVPKPGEISLAHNGALFLDEIAEFPKQILETLRQPLEDKFITINRAHSSLKYPSNFLLLATMNPCPCGYFQHKKIKCICRNWQILNYQKKLSGPLLDRFDIFLEVEKSPINKNLFTPSNEGHPLHKLINQVKQIQIKRFQNLPISSNSEMTLPQTKKYCQLPAATQAILNQATENLHFSNRAYLKILKLARTIADLENQTHIQEEHVLEALQYRNTLKSKLFPNI